MGAGYVTSAQVPLMTLSKQLGGRLKDIGGVPCYCLVAMTRERASMTLSGPLNSLQYSRDSDRFHGGAMTRIEAIQAEIESLSSEDFAWLAAWIAERDWQIERAAAAG
jgi:hypothetical protein